MSRKMSIKPLTISNTTPARNATNVGNGTCILNGEIAIVNLGNAGAQSLIVADKSTDTGYMVIGPHRIPHTFTIQGDITAGTVLPGFFPLSALTGAANYPRRASIVGAKAKLSAGTATVTIYDNASALASDKTVTTTAADFSPVLNSVLTSGSYVYLTVVSASSAVNLSVTIYVVYY